MSAPPRHSAGFSDRLADTVANAYTAARIAAVDMETAIEPRLPDAGRELSERLRARILDQRIVSVEFHRELRELIAIVGRAVEAETTVISVPIEGLVLAPGAEPITRMERQRSADGERLLSARSCLGDLDGWIAMSLDLVAAAKAIRQLLDN